jgi:hypothetical protein
VTHGRIQWLALAKKITNLSDCTKGGEVLVQISKYPLLEKNPAPWIQLLL